MLRSPAIQATMDRGGASRPPGRTTMPEDKPKYTEAQMLTLRATFTTRAADSAQAIADELRPRMFAPAEDRDEHHVAEDIARAERRRASALAAAAANELLAAAGFRAPRDRTRRRP